VALACDVSVSTAKRRLKDAEKHFVARAKRHEALLPWLEEGRWAIERKSAPNAAGSGAGEEHDEGGEA